MVSPLASRPIFINVNTLVKLLQTRLLVKQDSGGLLRKAISRISTEYRLQFAWPQGHHSRADSQQDSSLPKKSLSMGAIKPSSQASVHKKRNELDTKDGNVTNKVHKLIRCAHSYEHINVAGIYTEIFKPVAFSICRAFPFIFSIFHETSGKNYPLNYDQYR